MSKIDKLYEEYFNISSLSELISKKREIGEKDLINRMKKEKKILAEIIYETIKPVNSVEFSNTFYIDDGTIAPTISQGLIKYGVNATLVSPYVKSKNSHNFNTIKSPVGYPFANYEPSSIASIQAIKNTGVFITENNIDAYLKRFETYTGFGVPCVYATSGSIIEIVHKIERVKSIFSDNDNLDFEMDIKSEDDIAAGIYIIRRK